ncbi:uncharacterized protein LOC118164185 isoform X4 [Oxyura jamaicensis]|nr:uncharacterized protein LOC118164185 isoform X4 [Oxyura jamaicensis]
MQEPLLEGMCFTLKYLGMTLVEKPKGEDMAAAAIRRIIATAQVGARKFQKVILTVSPRGISLQDADTKEIVENISIYRISYCTTDKLQNKIFAYVAQSQDSGALECHAFLSPKKKIAQAVTLTVAQAFQMALDLWEAANAGSRQEQPLHPPCVLEHSEPGRARPCCYLHSLPCTWGPDMTRGTLCSVWLTRQEPQLISAPATPLSAWGDTTSLKEMRSLCLVIILPVWDKAQPCSSAQHPLHVQSQPKHSQCCKSLSLWPCPGASGCLLLYLMLPALAQPGSGCSHPCL